jgi:hypothetical protein
LIRRAGGRGMGRSIVEQAQSGRYAKKDSHAETPEWFDYQER